MGGSRSFIVAAVAAVVVGTSSQAGAADPVALAWPSANASDGPVLCNVGRGLQLGNLCVRLWTVVEMRGISGSRISHGASPVDNLTYSFSTGLQTQHYVFVDVGYRTQDGTNITLRRHLPFAIPSLEYVRIERPNGNEWTLRDSSLVLDISTEAGALQFGVADGPLRPPDVWIDAQTRLGPLGVGVFAQAGIDDFGLGPQFAPELDLLLSLHRSVEFEVSAHYDRVGLAGGPANAYGLDYLLRTRLGQHSVTIGGAYAHGSTQWMRSPGYSYADGLGDFDYWQAFAELELRWGRTNKTDIEVVYSRGPLVADSTIDFILEHNYAPTGGVNCNWCQTRIGASIWYEHAYLAPGTPLGAFGGAVSIIVPVN